MVEVEAVQLGLLLVARALMLVYQDEQRDQSMLVKRRLQELLEFAEREIAVCACNLPLVGNGQAEHPVALGILPGAGAKEMLQEARSLGIKKSGDFAFHCRRQ